MPKFLANTLKEWRLACPKSDLDLVFPNGAGKVESLANIINRGLIPAQGGKDATPSTPGCTCLRHFYASLVHRPGAAAEVIQERLGHASITMTYDRYGHLFPRDHDAQELDAAADAVLA